MLCVLSWVAWVDITIAYNWVPFPFHSPNQLNKKGQFPSLTLLKRSEQMCSKKEKTQTGPQSNRNAPPRSVYKFSVTYSVFHMLKHSQTGPWQEGSHVCYAKHRKGEKRRYLASLQQSFTVTSAGLQNTDPHLQQIPPPCDLHTGGKLKGNGGKTKKQGLFELCYLEIYSQSVHLCVCVCVLGALTHSQFVTLDASQWHGGGGGVKSYLRQCMGAHGRGH